MFKHILISTDGSDLSKIAIENGVQFASEVHAKITGITVTEPFHIMSTNAMQIADTPEKYDQDMLAMAYKNLNALKQAAEQAGVECDLVHCSSDHPYQEIVKTAEEHGCDVIFQASHGRSRLGAAMIGSETSEVLSHTKIPVMVYR